MERSDREHWRGPVEISAASASGAAATPRTRTRVGCRLDFPTPSDGPTPDHNRVPAAGLGRKRVPLMEIDQGDSVVPKGPAESFATWRTNHLESVGKATTRASGAGDWGLADGRQRNLMASRLKSLAGRIGAL